MHARIFGILMENHKDFYSKIDFTSHNISKRDFYGLLKFAIFFFPLLLFRLSRHRPLLILDKVELLFAIGPIGQFR